MASLKTAYAFATIGVLAIAVVVVYGLVSANKSYSRDRPAAAEVVAVKTLPKENEPIVITKLVDTANQAKFSRQLEPNRNIEIPDINLPVVSLIPPIRPIHECPSGTKLSGDPNVFPGEQFCYYQTKVENLVRHGSFVKYHNNGMIAESGNYDRGHRIGNWIRQHTNGSLLERCDYLDGKKHGTWAQWSQSGAFLSECFYYQGEKHGRETTYYENGFTKQEQSYEHGVKSGTSYHYFKDGTLKASGSYANGRKVDEWVHYSGLRNGRRYIQSKDLYNDEGRLIEQHRYRPDGSEQHNRRSR